MQASLVFVIPAFNAGATLRDTLASVLAQTRADIAALVVDDGSTDQTAAIAAHAAAADPRVRLVRQENRGLSAARNRGVAELLASMYSGPVSFLDADDAVDPRFAEVMLGALGSADAAACACRMAGPKLEDVGWIIRVGDHDLTPERMVEFNPLAVGSVVVRLESLARLNLLRGADEGGGLFDPGLSVHEDWDCWLRFTARGGRWAPMVPEALFSYRMLPGSMSGALERMYRVGLEVIARAPVADDVKAGASRRWALRHIARAVAAGDPVLTSRFLGEIAPPLSSADLETLAGSLPWAFCRAHQTGPARVAAAQELAWRERVRELLPGLDPERTAGRLRFGGDHWAQAAEAFIAALGRRQTGVIYGLGRNGRDLLAAIERVLEQLQSEALASGAPRPALPRIAWTDDHPSAAPPLLLGRPLPRLRADALRAGHIILVTPERRAGILGELAARGLPHVHTPETIACLAAGA